MIIETKDKIAALAKHLGCESDDVLDEDSDVRFSHGSREYLVMTDDEADAALEQALDSYIDDVILDQFPPAYANYFDRDAWKRDASHDGRGHLLSSYDGDEHEIRLEDGTYLYIYRTN
jgi:hypothetical protein